MPSKGVPPMRPPVPVEGWRRVEVRRIAHSPAVAWFAATLARQATVCSGRAASSAARAAAGSRSVV